MFPSRKDFSFQVAPSDRQLWAIGMIVVQWSSLEMLLGVATEALLRDDEEQLEAFRSDRSTKGRLDTLQNLVSGEFAQPHRDRFLALIRETRDAQFLRDRVAHGSWSSAEQVVLEDPEARSAFSWLGPRHPFEWKLTFGTLKELALRIESLNVRFQNAILDELKPGDTQILLSDAINKKRLLPQ